MFYRKARRDLADLRRQKADVVELCRFVLDTFSGGQDLVLRTLAAEVLTLHGEENLRPVCEDPLDGPCVPGRHKARDTRCVHRRRRRLSPPREGTPSIWDEYDGGSLLD